MSSDREWEKWGQKDPYYGVITREKFRSANLDEQLKEEFFNSGKQHIESVLTSIRKRIDPEFTPKRALDFGSGTGRLVLPLTSICDQVTGVDVSPSMIKEAQKNMTDRGVTNAEFVLSDDGLTQVRGEFDFIHSFIVFQHIPSDRGKVIFRELIKHLAPGGVAALHFTYARGRFADNYGVRKYRALYEIARKIKRGIAGLLGKGDPDIQMNPYPVSHLMFIAQEAGIHHMAVDLIDEGGEWSVFLMFQRPRA